jgi:hypothetical protein
VYTSAVSPEALEAKGMFVFTATASTYVSDFFSELAANVAAFDENPHAQIVQELVCLTAAEFALAPALVDARPILPIQEPTVVSDADIRLAVMKSNCNPIFCLEAVIRDRPLTLADIAAYGSDVAKLEAVGLSNREPPTEIGDVARAVDEVEQAYRQVPSGAAQAIGNSGVLRVQGFLWAVKLSLPHRDVVNAIDDAYEAFELSEPVGPAPVPVAR